MAIVITKQPQNIEVMEGKITQTLTVEATGATSYQWKKAKSATSTSGATNVTGQTTAEMTISTDLVAGKYYFFCVVSDDSSSVNSDIVIVDVVDFPTYITGAFVNAYIAACDTTVQERFKQLKTLSGIEIPDDDNVLRTAQVELFMTAL